MTPPSRRRFLGKGVRLGAAAGLGLAAAAAQGLMARTAPGRGGIPAGRRPDRRGILRPPGALEEEAFLAGCIRCYRCQDACDVGAIRFFGEADGVHYHTPYVDPALKACNLCMRCTQACPTQVLKPLEPDERSQAAMGSVALRTDLCLSYKAKRIRDEQAMLVALGGKATETEAETERRGPCGECYMFCPLRERAIQLEPGSFLAPVVFEKECVGCGMCEEICRVVTRGEPAIRAVPRRWKV